jgi:hypothetical protein
LELSNQIAKLCPFQNNILEKIQSAIMPRERFCPTTIGERGLPILLATAANPMKIKTKERETTDPLR